MSTSQPTEFILSETDKKVMRNRMTFFKQAKLNVEAAILVICEQNDLTGNWIFDQETEDKFVKPC